MILGCRVFDWVRQGCCLGISGPSDRCFEQDSWVSRTKQNNRSTDCKKPGTGKRVDARTNAAERRQRPVSTRARRRRAKAKTHKGLRGGWVSRPSMCRNRRQEGGEGGKREGCQLVMGSDASSAGPVGEDRNMGGMGGKGTEVLVLPVQNHCRSSRQALSMPQLDWHATATARCFGRRNPVPGRRMVACGGGKCQREWNKGDDDNKTPEAGGDVLPDAARA